MPTTSQQVAPGNRRDIKINLYADDFPDEIEDDDGPEPVMVDARTRRNLLAEEPLEEEPVPRELPRARVTDTLAVFVEGSSWREAIVLYAQGDGADSIASSYVSLDECPTFRRGSVRAPQEPGHWIFEGRIVLAGRDGLVANGLWRRATLEESLALAESGTLTRVRRQPSGQISAGWRRGQTIGTQALREMAQASLRGGRDPNVKIAGRALLDLLDTVDALRAENDALLGRDGR
jgi:hypothetical protein